VISGVLSRALELRDSGQLKSTTGTYFVKSMQRHFSEHGVPWSLNRD